MTSPAINAPPATPFNLRPLMLETFVCTLSMMAFVALAGPLARTLKLAPWQIGIAVTVAGTAWMLLARVWGALSDRRGRRPILLLGITGFSLAYAAMCAFLIFALSRSLTGSLVFAALLLGRGLAGVFYAAVPATSHAFVADHVPPEKRASALAALGASSGAGIVIGPAMVGLLSIYGLSYPLYVIGALPFITLIILWKILPSSQPTASAETKASLRLFDERLRRPMALAFISMFSVSVGQIIVGFFALDRLGLKPDEAARAAGTTMASVGFALILSQTLVRRLNWPSRRLIRYGALLGALGFGSVFFAQSALQLTISYFVAAAGLGWVFPAFAALAANSVAPDEQGAAAGAVSSAQGMGTVVGPLTGTLIYDIQPTLPYVLIGSLLVVGAIWGGKETHVAR